MITITIIEDQPIILEGIKVLINQVNDFEVVQEYPNGTEFIEHIDAVASDIILTDIEMPGMNGVTLTKRALITHPDLKIIALTMYNEQKYYYEMITAGAKGFVLKQASIEDLETAIREVHKGGNYFSKELLHSVIVGMHGLEKELAEEKKELLNITEREMEMLTCICQGLTNKELADKLFVSVKTIESNKAKLMQKTNTKNTAGLIVWAVKNKIVKL